MEVRPQRRIRRPHQLPEGGCAQHQVLVGGGQCVVGGSRLAHQCAAAAWRGGRGWWKRLASFLEGDGDAATMPCAQAACTPALRLSCEGPCEHTSSSSILSAPAQPAHDQQHSCAPAARLASAKPSARVASASSPAWALTERAEGGGVASPGARFCRRTTSSRLLRGSRTCEGPPRQRGGSRRAGDGQPASSDSKQSGHAQLRHPLFSCTY